MKVIELFSGIGAPHEALKRVDIDCEVIGCSEIDNRAIKAYELLHGKFENFGDITQINSLPYCDFLHASTPCTGFSIAGKREGTKNKQSSLIVHFYRLLDNMKEENKLPKVISFENVDSLVTLFSETFNELLDKISELDYNIYYSILQTCYFNNCNARKRLFLIAIRKDIDDGSFKMPENKNMTSLRIKDIMEEKYPENEIVNAGKDLSKRHYYPNNDILKSNGWIDRGSGKSTGSNIFRTPDRIFGSFTTRGGGYILQDNIVRRILPIEAFRSFGWTDEEFSKIKDNFSKSALIHLIGNSIPLGPLEAIYTNLKPLLSKIK